MQDFSYHTASKSLLNPLKNPIQRFFLIVCLLCGILNAESSALGAKESEWRIFLGAEAGAGLFASDSALFVGINPVALNRFPMGVGYSVGVMGGLQKYTYEKVGIRHTFGYKFSYIPNATSIRNKTVDEVCLFNCNDKQVSIANSRGNHNTVYYALEGLFDFVKTDEDHRFGMTFGIGLDFVYSRVGQNDGGAWALGTIRMGLYTQFDNSILDLTLKLPAIGGGLGIVTYDTVATIGFKHLF